MELAVEIDKERCAQASADLAANAGELSRHVLFVVRLPPHHFQQECVVGETHPVAQFEQLSDSVQSCGPPTVRLAPSRYTKRAEFDRKCLEPLRLKRAAINQWRHPAIRAVHCSLACNRDGPEHVKRRDGLLTAEQRLDRTRDTRLRRTLLEEIEHFLRALVFENLRCRTGAYLLQLDLFAERPLGGESDFLRHRRRDAMEVAVERADGKPVQFVAERTECREILGLARRADNGFKVLSCRRARVARPRTLRCVREYPREDLACSLPSEGHCECARRLRFAPCADLVDHPTQDSIRERPGLARPRVRDDDGAIGVSDHAGRSGHSSPPIERTPVRAVDPSSSERPR